MYDSCANILPFAYIGFLDVMLYYFALEKILSYINTMLSGLVVKHYSHKPWNVYLRSHRESLGGKQTPPRFLTNKLVRSF